MTRIIRFCSAMLHPRRRETARKGVRPCSSFLSLLIVALLVLPSFGHETEHHRITERILNELLDLRDDVDELLRGNRNPDPDPDPDPDPGPTTRRGITHRVTSACRDTVHWRMFQFQSLGTNATRLGSWPGGNEVYVLRFNETLEENLSCIPNAYVCYGGRNTRTRGYWGVGVLALTVTRVVHLAAGGVPQAAFLLSPRGVSHAVNDTTVRGNSLKPEGIIMSSDLGQ